MHPPPLVTDCLPRALGAPLVIWVSFAGAPERDDIIRAHGVAPPGVATVIPEYPRFYGMQSAPRVTKTPAPRSRQRGKGLPLLSSTTAPGTGTPTRSAF